MMHPHRLGSGGGVGCFDAAKVCVMGSLANGGQSTVRIDAFDFCSLTVRMVIPCLAGKERVGEGHARERTDGLSCAPAGSWQLAEQLAQWLDGRKIRGKRDTEQQPDGEDETTSTTFKKKKVLSSGFRGKVPQLFDCRTMENASTRHTHNHTA